MIIKIEVEKSAYDDVRGIEAMTRRKISEETNALYHAALLNDTWGVYQITHCYKSFFKYYAKVKLIEATASEAEAYKRLEYHENKKHLGEY